MWLIEFILEIMPPTIEATVIRMRLPPFSVGPFNHLSASLRRPVFSADFITRTNPATSTRFPPSKAAITARVVWEFRTERCCSCLAKRNFR